VNARFLWTAIVVLVAGAAIWIVAPFFTGGSSQPAGPAGFAGQTAPVFDMHDDSGAPASLAAYRGRIVVMNLWASWCPPCREEMPDLQRLAQAYPARVVVVGVNQGESAERARAFAHSLGIRFPIWIDDRQQYGRVYGALGLPTTVIVDRNGVVVRGFDGPLSYGQMRAAIASVR